MASAPLASIIMGVYNGQAYLTEALEGLGRQTMEDWELIAVDDASTDQSAEMLTEWARRDRRVRVLANGRNLGLARSLNLALDHARGAYVVRQDADDISLPHRLARQVEAMEREPGLALMGAGIFEMSPQGVDGAVSRPPTRPAVIKRKMLFDSAFFHPTVIWRREALARRGMRYDQRLRYAQDYELFSRVLWELKAGNLGEPLVRLRVHAGQVSKLKVDGQQGAADRVAWSNFGRMGLTGEFCREDVALMRRLGVRARGLSVSQRRRQWRLWRRLMSLLEQGLGTADREEWRAVRLNRLGLLRRSLAGWPPLVGGLARAAAMEPGEALTDLAAFCARRLKRT